MEPETEPGTLRDAGSRPPAYATFIPETKDINVAKREVTHLITNDSWDRAGDLVEEDGWDFDAYKRNAVVLADHRYSIFSIIGKSIGLDKGKEGIFSTTRFDQGGIGVEAFRLVEADLAKAWSVGFRGLEFESIMQGSKAKCATCAKRMKVERERLGLDDTEPVWLWGTHFTRQELMEYSLVAIPMNADIVSHAVSQGLVSKGHVPLFFRHSHDLPVVPAPAPATPPPAPEADANPGSIADVRRVNPARAIMAAVQDAQYNVRSSTQHAQIAQVLRRVPAHRR